MRLRTFFTAVASAKDAFLLTLKGSDAQQPTSPATLVLPPQADVCQDERVLQAAEALLLEYALRPCEFEDLQKMASRGGQRVGMHLNRYGLAQVADSYDYPRGIRWCLNNSGKEITIFLPRKNDETMSAEHWAFPAVVALKGGATGEDAETLITGLALSVRGGQLPAT